MIKQIKLACLAVACCVGWVACDTEKEREICDYKVQLRYDYNEENTTTENRIEYWVYTIDEYIFDENNLLYQYRQVTPERCVEYMHSELELPPGRYSVIAVGNRDERSTATDTRTNSAPVIGVTHRDDMRLSLDNCESRENGTKGPCEELFHGYKTFTVKENGISRVRVDMINAHFQLRFRVTWKNNTTPDRGNYYATLESIPSEYILMPEYIYTSSSVECEPHDCDAHDLYPDNCNNVIHHIPRTCHQNRNVLTHRNDTYINADSEMWGQFVNYRIKTETVPVLRIYDSAGTQIIKDIDLQRYFDWYNYELDYELKQEYEMDIIVDGTTVTLVPLNVADWDEGGVIY